MTRSCGTSVQEGQKHGRSRAQSRAVDGAACESTEQSWRGRQVECYGRVDGDVEEEERLDQVC